MTNLIWYPQNLDIVNNMWLKHSPEEIAKAINEKLKLKYQGKNIIYETTARGVLFKACDLGLINAEMREYLEKKLRKEKARKRYIPEKIRNQVLIFDNNKCLLCGADEDLSVDHIIAVVNGGDNSLENLQTLCRSCNSKKMSDEVNFRRHFEKYYCESCNSFHFRNIEIV